MSSASVDAAIIWSSRSWTFLARSRPHLRRICAGERHVLAICPEAKLTSITVPNVAELFTCQVHHLILFTYQV